MANYDSYIDGTYGKAPKTRRIDGALYLLTQTVNFAQQNLDAGNGDVLRVLAIRPETLVLKCWARVLSAAPTNATVDLGYGSDVNYWGNGLKIDAAGIPDTVLTGTVERSGAAIAVDDSETNIITIAGATFGDTCTVNMSDDAEDLMFHAYVQAATKVETVAQNDHTDTVDPDGTYEVFVDKAPMGHQPLLFTSADTIDLIATTDLQDVNIISGILRVGAICLDERLA